MRNMQENFVTSAALLSETEKSRLLKPTPYRYHCFIYRVIFVFSRNTTKPRISPNDNLCFLTE